MKNLRISTDKTKMDLELIHSFLSGSSYWAKGRSRERMARAMEHSCCYAVFTAEGRQIAFARLLTDYVVFAWLMDVFVIPEYRSKGVGKFLVQNILNDEKLSEVRGIGLRTEDAHGLYTGFGFQAIPKPDTWMYKRISELP